jgi:hypothetical protein
MLEVKTRLVAPALMALAGIALVGCDASKEGPVYPPPSPAGATIARFDPLAGYFPYPSDLFFAPTAADPGTVDLTLNLPALPFRSAAMQAAINSQDGWSTTASIITSFTRPIKAASLNQSTVRVIELYMSDRTTGVASAAEIPPGAPCLATNTCPVRKVLTFGTDYIAEVSDDVDSEGKVLRITPLKPLDPSTGPIMTPGNVSIRTGYLVVLTNGVQDDYGLATTSDATYASIKGLLGQYGPAGCAGLPDAASQGLCGLIAQQLGIAQAVDANLSPADVTLTWTVTTQSVDDPLNWVAAFAAARPTGVVATGMTTHDVFPTAPTSGKADIYVGTTVVPYFLTKSATPSDPAVLTKFWKGAGGPFVAPGLNYTQGNLTRFNPQPVKTEDLTIPLLVTVPNATAAGGACVKPATGWPVAIVQHGIGGNRTNALAMADAFANACFVVAAIDLPLHGLTDTANPFYQAANERTFNVDLVAPKLVPPALPSKATIDPSGTHFINLSSPATGRDNLRQAEADLITFTKSIATLDLPGAAAPDIDPAHISFVGLSLGAIVGGGHIHFTNDTRTATLSVPGGVVTQLLLDSPTFGPGIRAGLAAQSSLMVPNSWVFNMFFRDAQTVVDSGDPINHILDAQKITPLHLTMVVGNPPTVPSDTVVPNSATIRLIQAGGLRKLTTTGPNQCNPATNPNNIVGQGTGAYTSFTAGYHGSLFDPAVNLAATTEMQKEAVMFAAGAVGPAHSPSCVVLSDASVLDLQP